MELLACSFTCEHLCNGVPNVFGMLNVCLQAWYTKNYLRHTRRGECYLPDGPLLVTPFSLYIAFKKLVRDVFFTANFIPAPFFIPLMPSMLHTS